MVTNKVDAVSDLDIEITPQGNHLWNVRLSFPTLEASEKGMLAEKPFKNKLLSLHLKIKAFKP